MPNRIIREGIIDSEAVNSLSFDAEVFYRRLMSVVDDFGRFDGRTAVLRARLYALQLDKVREANLERWIAECVKARLIRLYESNGKPYVLLLKLGAPRAKASKYPAPPDETVCECNTLEDEHCAQMQADANICAQTQEDVPYSYSSSYSSSINPPSPPEGGQRRQKKEYHSDPLFLQFWQAYPLKVGKGKAAEAFAKHSPSEDLLASMLAAISWQARSEDWLKDDGRYIPQPATWLNQRRWEDEPRGRVPTTPAANPIITDPPNAPPLNYGRNGRV